MKKDDAAFPDLRPLPRRLSRPGRRLRAASRIVLTAYHVPQNEQTRAIRPGFVRQSAALSRRPVASQDYTYLGSQSPCASNRSSHILIVVSMSSSAAVCGSMSAAIYTSSFLCVRAA